ncbi:MAG: 23S rRNA (uracil(1939)-C(5))-methyltransferase RlmD [Acidobacteria bacterium]|nr:23S rRNA (uracil(1939)-C(5))-methyltransferase RlmD [Acidobacteriota bacterium]
MKLTIEKLVYGGDGLARIKSGEQTKTVFVPFVIPGEGVEATEIEQRPGFSRARLDEVLEPSELRISAPCPYFGSCGGCQYQHITYDAQLRFKSEILRETLLRTAKLDLASEIQIHRSEPFHYRNRTRFHVSAHPHFAVGYFRPGSHDLLSVRECPISSPLINRTLPAVWELGQAGQLPSALVELEMFAGAEDNALLAEAYFSTKVKSDELSRFSAGLVSRVPELGGLIAFYLNPDKASRSLEGQTVFGSSRLQYRVAGETYAVSAGAFFQTNRFVLPEMLSVVAGKKRGKLALDLYAGVGLFTVALARGFDRVIAVESSPVSVSDLRANAPENVKISAQTVEAYLSSAAGQLRPDLIVVDPPRNGLGTTVCRHLNDMRASQMVYVSCDPATLARDLKQLLTGDWRVEEMHLLDLFPQTFHIESCAVLRR